MAAKVFPRLCLLLASLLGSAPAFAEPVTLERDVQLKSEPRADASVVATLKRGMQAEALTTKGPWLQLKAASATGWAFTFDVRYASSQPGSGGAGAGTALSRLTTRQPPAITATIGVRGITTETLRNAQFDEAQVAQLERYRSTDQQARAGASASGLKASQINYLDAK